MRQPKWQRRAEDRPREICDAALEVFAEKGFAAAKLDEIARRAGVSKGTLYLYFNDKEDLFRAVVRSAIAPNIEAITSVIAQAEAPFADIVRMDEAERCHEIAYIFNGNLIAQGTGDEVIAQSGLVTYEAEGPRADRLAGELAGKPGIDMVAPFGQALHVSGTDRAALEHAIGPYRRDELRWTEVQPTLEDVFINLMRTHSGEEAKAA